MACVDGAALATLIECIEAIPRGLTSWWRWDERGRLGSSRILPSKFCLLNSRDHLQPLLSRRALYP